VRGYAACPWVVILGGRLVLWRGRSVLGNADPLPLEKKALSQLQTWDVGMFCEVLAGCLRIWGLEFLGTVSANLRSLLLLELLLGLFLWFSGQGVIPGANTMRYVSSVIFVAGIL